MRVPAIRVAFDQVTAWWLGESMELKGSGGGGGGFAGVVSFGE